MGEPFTIKKTYSTVAEMNADFNNMQLGDYVMIASTVEVEDNAKLYTRGESQWIFITDFSGATGIRGETGLTPNIQIGTVTQGTSFNVTRTGTNENPVLNFTLVKGDKGDQGIQGIQGLTGNGISSITKTGTSGLVDTYTITYTNGNTTTFTITNGEDGEVTETELNVLREKVANQQKVISQLPQVEGQGTEITLENTIEAPFTIFDVEGNSVQDGTPSPDNEVPIYSAGDNENKFDGEILSKSTDVTFSNGKIVIPKYTNNTQFITFNTNSYQKNTLYTVSFKAKSTVDGALIRFDGQPDSATTASNLFPDYGCTINKEEQQFSITGQMTEDFEGLRFFRINSFAQANTSEIEIYDIKIEQGNKASGYSPYGMGSINEKISNKNVINIQPFTVTGGTTSYNGRDFTVNLKAGTYTLQRKYTKSSNAPNSAGMVQLKRNNVYYKNLDAGVASTIVELTEDTALTLSFYLSTSITSSSSSSIDFYDIQLEEGSTSTPYVPHKEQTYSIPVQQPMRSIGDVRDGFVKKSDGWYERHYIGRKIFDGTETGWFYNLDNGHDRFNIIESNIAAGSSTNNPVLSTHFKSKYGIEDGNIFLSSLGDRFVIICDSIHNLQDWKTWLSTNNLEVIYQLETPLDLPCTPEQIQQIENKPSTYKDFTYVVSEDETKAYLEVSGIYDLNNLINN